MRKCEGKMPIPLKFANVYDAFREPVVHPDPVTGNLVPKITNQSLLLLTDDTGINCSLGWDTAATLVNASLTLTVDDNDFSAPAVLYLHTYKLVSNIDWLVGGSATDSATNLAAAISRLDGFSATSLLEVVTILGPRGAAGFNIAFKAAYGAGVVNFLFSTADFMTSATITKPYLE
jgi:hypothetical protein